MDKRFSNLMAALLLGGLAACAATPQHQATGEYIDDAAITTQVKAAIVDDPKLKVSEVHVDTLKGVVQLSGFVSNSSQIAEAGTVAAGVPGVKSVRNALQLK